MCRAAAAALRGSLFYRTHSREMPQVRANYPSTKKWLAKESRLFSHS
jgi:hypothetical protein